VYIDKMLRVGGLLAVDDCTWPSMRKFLRYVVTNRRYSVIECLDSPRSRKDLLARSLRPLTRCFGAIFKPEVTEPDGLLALRPGSRCVVMRKEAEDQREITDHRAF
jgi:hypothetical protein